MGSIFSSLFDSLMGVKREVRVLLLGLDAAGKTTVLYRLQLNEVVTTVPTIGFNVETVRYKGVDLMAWDLGGQSSIRPYWRCYFAGTDAVLFVVDSCDKERMPTARAELHALMEEEELKDAVLLVMANKQDMEGAMDADAISEALGLADLKGRTWGIQEASATKGVGVFEGFDFIVDHIASK